MVDITWTLRWRPRVTFTLSVLASLALMCLHQWPKPEPSGAALPVGCSGSWNCFSQVALHWMTLKSWLPASNRLPMILRRSFLSRIPAWARISSSFPACFPCPFSGFSWKYFHNTTLARTPLSQHLLPGDPVEYLNGLLELFRDGEENWGVLSTWGG